MKVIGRQALKEIGRDIFQNHIIRFKRAVGSANAPITVVVDLWELDGTFPNKEVAGTVAREYVRSLAAA